MAKLLRLFAVLSIALAIGCSSSGDHVVGGVPIPQGPAGNCDAGPDSTAVCGTWGHLQVDLSSSYVTPGPTGLPVSYLAGGAPNNGLFLSVVGGVPTYVANTGGVTWAGDLAGSTSSSQKVVALQGGLIGVTAGTGNFLCAATATGCGISYANTTSSASAVIIAGQTCTAASCSGGGVVLLGGNGGPGATGGASSMRSGGGSSATAGPLQFSLGSLGIGAAMEPPTGGETTGEWIYPVGTNVVIGGSNTLVSNVTSGTAVLAFGVGTLPASCNFGSCVAATSTGLQFMNADATTMTLGESGVVFGSQNTLAGISQSTTNGTAHTMTVAAQSNSVGAGASLNLNGGSSAGGFGGSVNINAATGQDAFHPGKFTISLGGNQQVSVSSSGISSEVDLTAGGSLVLGATSSSIASGNSQLALLHGTAPASCAQDICIFGVSGSGVSLMDASGHVTTIGNGALTFNATTLISTSSGTVGVGPPAGALLSVGTHGLQLQSFTIAGNYTIDTTQSDYFILINSAGVTHTITLPTPTAGRVIVLKDIGAGVQATPWTIAQHASEKIENIAAGYSFNVNLGTLSLMSDGTNWWKI